MEQWAKEWIKDQRKQGTKCLEVELIDNNHYKYHSMIMSTVMKNSWHPLNNFL